MINLGRLRVDNFKSFNKPFEVDFSESDLFIFDGPNGFGKTTLFDAIELCLTDRIGRIENTDNKQKNSHILKFYSEKPTTIFLELKEGMATQAVVYAYIPPNTSKVENKPGNCTVTIKLLKAWPEDFDDLSTLIVEQERTLADITGNREIKDTFDLFNYVQQEETCHFLKNKENERHNKISYLFGTTRQNTEKDRINQIRNKLARKLQEIESETAKLNTNKSNIEQSLNTEFTEAYPSQKIFPSGKIERLINFNPDSHEQLQRFETCITDFEWVLNNVDEYQNLEFNSLLNLLLEERELALKDIVLVGHLSSYKEIAKAEKHSRWLNELAEKILSQRVDLSLASDKDEPLTRAALEQLIERNPLIAAKYSDRTKVYFELLDEVGTYQDILGKISKSRTQLKACFDSHIGDAVDKKVSCPFCGDIKDSAKILWDEYEKQSEIFEALKSVRLSRMEGLQSVLSSTFVEECANKSKKFILKYERYLELAPALNELLISKERWDAMVRVKSWLERNNIPVAQFVKSNSHESVANRMQEKLFEFKSYLRSSAKLTNSEANLLQIKTSLKHHQIRLKGSKLYNSYDVEIGFEDLKQDRNFIRVLDARLNTDSLKAISSRLHELKIQKDKLHYKHDTVRSIFNKIAVKIKEYETSVAKQIAIPFYVFSSKILQTRPDGNGAYIKSAENNRENGYIRFVSNFNDEHDAWNTMSSGQLSGLILSFMLAMNKVYPTNLKTLLIDDPVQTMDEINLASFVQLLRNEFPNNQIIMSTHERKSTNFFRYKYRNNKQVNVLNMKQERLSQWQLKASQLYSNLTSRYSIRYSTVKPLRNLDIL